MTDFRALCAELVDDLELCDWPYKLKDTIRADINRARAALAQPEPEGPTDEELESVARAAEIQNMEEQGGFNANDANGVAVQLQRQRLAGLRAVLSRWGCKQCMEFDSAWLEAKLQKARDEELEACCEWLEECFWGSRNIPDLLRAARRPTPQPTTEQSSTVQLADGEVAEVVKWLRSRAGIPASPDFPAVVAYLTRAADLLERLSPPQPIPVSERLPGPEDCDAEGRCWWGVFQDDELLMRAWHFERQTAVWRFACWLPAHALPLPTDD